jgi:endoglucanase
MNRRNFAEDRAALCVAEAVAPRPILAAEEVSTARYNPAGRGFNLPGRFAMPGPPHPGAPLDESEFATRTEWCFDLARLPLSYWAWGNRDECTQICEEPLKGIDRAVDWGRHYGIRLNLNFQRVPGYCKRIERLSHRKRVRPS